MVCYPLHSDKRILGLSFCSFFYQCTYERIEGFASCFNCKDTYSFQSGGCGSTKHLLKHTCSKVSLENNRGPIDKFVRSKDSLVTKVTPQDCAKFRDDLTKWICTSIRPFNIVADPGLKTAFQTIIDICNFN